MISYETTTGTDLHNLRMGTSDAGVQISFGSFSGSRPCSVALNNASGSNCIYTGVGKNATNDICPTFPQAFAEAPTALATPQAGTYWFGDALASTNAITRLDFYTNKKYTSTSALSVGGHYIAIGKYGSTDIGTALNDVRAYWNGDHDIRIPVDDSTAIQISSGSLSKSGTFAAMNSTLYRASINPAKNFSNAFSSTPKVFISPSMKCREWDNDTKFSHPYWFGGVTADSTRITQLDAYTNKSIGSKTIYGRYIAIGLCANNVSGWTQVPVSLTKGGNGGYVLRFGNAEGMQLAFGEIHFNDRKIQKQLNDATSANIYTAYKEAPAYKNNEPMYFVKAFSESPSTVVMTNMACRHNDANGKAVFDHPYWFGDAASDAVCIMNLDLYTNNKYTTDQDVYAKYLAAGCFSASADEGAKVIRNALTWMNEKHKDALYNDQWPDNVSFSNIPIGQAILMDYTAMKGLIGKSGAQISFNSAGKPLDKDGNVNSINGWCSEFASVMAENAGIDEAVFPREPSVSKFKDSLGNHYCTPVMESDKSLSGTFQGNIVPAVGDLLFTQGTEAGHTCLVINANGSYVYTIEGNRKDPNESSNGELYHIVRRDRRRIKGTPEGDNRTILAIGSINWN